jgi:hypothetical protein
MYTGIYYNKTISAAIPATIQNVVLLATHLTFSSCSGHGQRLGGAISTLSRVDYKTSIKFMCMLVSPSMISVGEIGSVYPISRLLWQEAFARPYAKTESSSNFVLQYDVIDLLYRRCLLVYLLLKRIKISGIHFQNQNKYCTIIEHLMQVIGVPIRPSILYNYFVTGEDNKTIFFYSQRYNAVTFF